MPSYPRKEATLPSVVASLTTGLPARALTLTILFHPDLERIGERCDLPLAQIPPRIDLGRYQPLFVRDAAGAAGAGSALAEPHISRQALSLEYCDNALQLIKLPGTCRCLLDGEELAGTRTLGQAQLRRGVALTIGHAVVLWLGEQALLSSDDEALPDSPLLGGSTLMRQLRQQVARAAAADLDVLILGETGVGKELVAQSIHHASERGRRTLVAVNMAAIPVELAPALLFGSVKGAYTGAVRPSAGFFQQAAGGSLFMDEIGATPAEIQPQLLRALQQRQVQVVGGAPEQVDLRVIAATDAPLDDAACGFSAALRHRLGSIELRVPPLREHPEDVGELLLHQLREASEHMGCAPLLPAALDSDLRVAQWAALFQQLANYHWPGNVRELANVARQLVVAGEASPRMPALAPAASAAETNTAVAESSPGGPAAGTPVAGEASAPPPPRRRMNHIDDATLRAAYRDSGFEVAATARTLGVSRQSVYRRLQALPDVRLASDIPAQDIQAALAECDDDHRAAARLLEVSANALQARMRGSGALT